jgi:osmotically-inducible protein OsmY
MIARANHDAARSLLAARDIQLRASVLDALKAMPYAALRNLTCRVSEGTAEITGTVPTFYLKQLAQAAVLQLSGVRIVRNLIEVEG